MIFMLIFLAILLSAIGGGITRGRLNRMGPGGPPPSSLYGPQQPRMLQDPYSQQDPFAPHRDPFAQYNPYGMQQMGGWQGAQQIEQPLSDASKEAVDTDITRFGGELRDLDLDVVGLELSPEAQADYTKALDAYENAKQSLRNAELDSDATHITHILEEGRYAIECVKARAHGRPLPERRPPCFFNPAHGPSVADVDWAPDGGVARRVPACALDAARVQSGANPHIRMVPVMNGQLVPYWEDSRQAAWARGYYEPYGMDPAIRQLTQGALMIGGFSLLMGLFHD
ncbi:hypothetical protein LKO27_02710 [Tessaracoccus sp. OS52]|uniref:hypothetical protein n=1 Tax=Tessaracoccus sp. OS52 TaxID=2886691 RepID=UPI001D10622C|nr:hypothetical protein [Tessaracoccus sp. OS52]MCC2592335.1 hypothetical protein [Tessaracoccus sp. OS52]